MNPYDPPLAPLPDQSGELRHENDKPERTALIVWPFVFALNLIVPLLFGRSLLRETGLIGLSIAVALFLIAGWYLCYVSPFLARRLLVGSGVTAVSQIFPLIQLVAGIIAFGIVAKLGLATDDSDIGIGNITHEVGGFLVTMITGLIIATIAMVIGAVTVVMIGGFKGMWNYDRGKSKSQSS